MFSSVGKQTAEKTIVYCIPPRDARAVPLHRCCCCYYTRSTTAAAAAADYRTRRHPPPFARAGRYRAYRTRRDRVRVCSVLPTISTITTTTTTTTADLTVIAKTRSRYYTAIFVSGDFRDRIGSLSLSLSLSFSSGSSSAGRLGNDSFSP